MAKKKKTQLKPVVRGFATTSIAKKVIPLRLDGELEPETPCPAELTEDSEGCNSSWGKGVNSPDDVADAQTDGFDPDKVEEQSLQNLVNKLQDRIDKEVARAVKAIEADRRFSKTLPCLELDSILVDRILSLSLDSRTVEGLVRRPIGEVEEKAISKLGVTYCVLRRLGFSESRVCECLRAINGVELEEAYDWMYLNCTEEELEEQPSEESSEPGALKTSKAPRTMQSSHAPITPRIASQFLVPAAEPAKSSHHLDANAPSFKPANSSRSSSQGSDYDVGNSFVKSQAIASFDHGACSSMPSGYPSDVDDPNAEYVRLKLQLSHLTSAGCQPEERTEAIFIHDLRVRLEAIKMDYLFDEKEAETQYQVELEKANTAALRSSLRGDIEPAEALLTRKSTMEQPNLQPPKVSPLTIPDLFDGDDEDSSGGVFEILDDMPTTETNDRGTTIRIRDMALPKHWSGRTPKKLLYEAVVKADRYAAITYRIVSRNSRAKRAAVNIRWDRRKMGDFVMEDVACHDETQAEQYIATIALHALMFPTTEGFMAGASAAPGNQTFFRLLPAVFRDLWDELEVIRKTNHDAVNRSVWAQLRSIIEPKMDREKKTIGKGSKPTVNSRDSSTLRTAVQSNDLTPEQLMAAFCARQSGPAYQEMMLHRNCLPIAPFRNEIIVTLEQSQVLVLSGETGCGKSTQVPAFILEDQLSRGKPCKIYCTEPRRISAISLAQRVSRELGIALRMLEGGTGEDGQGTAFDEITHIVVDEVHERTIESDFLLIVLKSLLVQRADLKVVLMSATLDAEKISKFFGSCPMLHIPGRTFPVHVQYLEDAVESTQWSISETSPYARRFQDKFYRGKNRADWSEETGREDDDEDEAAPENVKLGKRYSPSTASTINLLDERIIPYDLIIRLLEFVCFEDASCGSYSQAILIFMPGMREIRRLNDMLTEHPSFGSGTNFKIYPLHSTLSSENQGAVFDIPPRGIRKLVIATNIAETGITIPDITCVIDTGKQRQMRFDEKRHISRLAETFVAKSNATQRRGRAGRVQPGLCFHLFTKLRYDSQMAEHPLPEMMRLSLSDLALRIKIINVRVGSSIEDVLSRALDPPASINVQRAVSMLVEVHALTPSEEITPMGRLLSKLPTDVHLGKFLLIATLFRCLDPALTIAATLNSKSPFVSPFGMEKEADCAKNAFRIENSDFLTIHNAFCSWRRASANPGFIRKFCRTNFLSHQNLQQVEELRQQFLGYLIDSSFIQVDRSFIRELSRARYGRNRARFVSVPPELDCNSGNTHLLNAALAAGLYPKILTIDPTSGQMRTISNNQPAAFHPSSVNFGRRATEFGVNYLSYFTLMHSKKLYVWETGPVDDIAIFLLCGEADFKLISNYALIDRKVKVRLSPKANIAMKYLRRRLGGILADQFCGEPLDDFQKSWNEIALKVLGRSKLEVASNDSCSIVVVA